MPGFGLGVPGAVRRGGGLCWTCSLRAGGKKRILSLLQGDCDLIRFERHGVDVEPAPHFPGFRTCVCDPLAHQLGKRIALYGCACAQRGERPIVGLPAVALRRPAELPISERELALLGAWLADPFPDAVIPEGPIQAARVPPYAPRLRADEVLDHGAWDLPYGYAVVRGGSGGTPIRLVVHPEEAEIVARVLHLAGPGGGALSIRSTLAALDKAGYVGREGRPLTRDGVVKILNCSVYATGGLIPVRRQHARRRAACDLMAPALVDSDVYEEAKRAREGRRAKNAAPRLTTGPTLLLGIARCGRCGGEIAMRTSDSGRARRIVCVGPDKASAGCGLAHAMEQIDRLVLDAVADAALATERATILAAALNARRGEATALLAARRRSACDRVDQARTRAEQFLRRHPEDKPVALGTLQHLVATEGEILSGSVRVQAHGCANARCVDDTATCTGEGAPLQCRLRCARCACRRQGF